MYMSKNEIRSDNSDNSYYKSNCSYQGNIIKINEL